MGLIDRLKAALRGGGWHRLPGTSSGRTATETDASAGATTQPPEVSQDPSDDEVAPARLRRHTVLPGETVDTIAEAYGATGPDLAALNGIEEPELIYAGQVFRVPRT